MARKASVIESPAFAISHCQKCGGISHDPHTPISSSIAQRFMTPTSPQPDERQYAPITNIVSPQNRMIRPGVPAHLPLNTTSTGRRPAEHDDHNQITPDPKRRRMTNGTHGPPHVSTPIITAYPPSAPHFRDSFGNTDPAKMRYAQPAPPYTMGPPPRPPQAVAQSSVSVPNSAVNHSQPQFKPPRPPLPMAPPPMNFLTKLTLLSRISPPFSFIDVAKSSADSLPTPPLAKRGALVSFEGDNLEAVTEAVNWLGEFLCRSDEYKVRTASGPKVIATDEKVTIIDYLDLIRDWHDKSKEMIEFITAASSPTTSDAMPTNKSNNGDLSQGKDGAADKARESASTSPAPLAPRPDTSSSIASLDAIPLILLRRYQLHASNTFAQHIPLGPTYSPVDHWQWMATLWRGTVGPDLTVYIKDYDDTIQSGPTSAMPEPMGPDSRNWNEVVGRNKGVEVMQDRGLLIVWKKKGGPVEEAALRRLAFEIGEGARGLWERK